MCSKEQRLRPHDAQGTGPLSLSWLLMHQRPQGLGPCPPWCPQICASYLSPTQRRAPLIAGPPPPGSGLLLLTAVCLQSQRCETSPLGVSIQLSLETASRPHDVLCRSDLKSTSPSGLLMPTGSYGSLYPRYRYRERNNYSRKMGTCLEDSKQKTPPYH